MSQNSKPHKVLVVDDDPVIRDMMVDMLDFEGYPARVARNGREALQIMRDGDSYLVFLDLMMPVMSGEQVCQVLEAEPHLRNRHIIVLMSAMDKLEEATALNPDSVIQKPFVVDDVMRVIEPYMG